MPTTKTYLENLVLSIHRRNSGTENSLDLNAAISSPRYGLDSMDLAEVVAHIQREFGVTLFEGDNIPQIWMDVVRIIESNGK